MCDYSLAGIPNRLAVEGEELAVHRFPTGSIGLASPSTTYRCGLASRQPPFACRPVPGLFCSTFQNVSSTISRYVPWKK